MGGSKKSNKSVPQAGQAAGTPAKPDAKEKPRQTCLHSQLHKTKFCLYHLKGACQFGASCSFAHSCAELQATPDLRKTRLCVNFFEGGGCTDADCTFAHSEDDLRSTDMFYKKTLCIWNEKGKCRNGDQCRFAHGLGELRLNQKPVEQISAPQEKRREAEKTVRGAVRAEKTETVKEVKAEKDCLNTGEDMGRQVSDTSQVTTASGGSNGSTTGSLSGNDGSTTGTFSTTTRRARARGKRGGGAATKMAQVQDSSSSSGTGSGSGAPQPMKVLLNRNLLSVPTEAPPQPVQPAPTQPPVAADTVAAALTASSLSLLNGTYDPLLEVELRKLRASVNALAMQCNHINQQINAEAMMSQAALRQQLLQLTQARQEELTQASWLARSGNSHGLMNLNALLSAASLSG